MKLILLLVLVAIPASLRAQAAPLRIEGSGQPVTVSVAPRGGHPSVSLATLRSIGAQVDSEPGGARVALFGDTLRFQAFSPFFRAGGRIHQLAAPVAREGGSLYLPLQFLTEWLPKQHPAQVQFRGGALRLAATPAVPAPKPAASPAAPARKPGQGEVRVVVIDAGHGGRDPGKVGPNGLQEKQVTLAVAKQLAAALRQRGGYEVHLTRTADTLVALADRPRLANQWKAGRPAALFVSIHANSGPARAHGFETFFLSEARTEDERRVAEMENAAVAFEDEPAAVAGEGLEWILNHLRNDFYLRASNTLAETIQRRIAGVHPGPDRGVKQAGFRVLVGAFMPAVLVEIGFISNSKEAAMLSQEAFRKRVAASLADAIHQFFSSHEYLWVAGSEN